jgi:hypothetical protein
MTDFYEFLTLECFAINFEYQGSIEQVNIKISWMLTIKELFWGSWLFGIESKWWSFYE